MFTSSWSPSLDLALLLPVTLPELLSVLAEPPVSNLPRVRRERRGAGGLTKSTKDPAPIALVDWLQCAEDTLSTVMVGKGEMLCTGSKEAYCIKSQVLRRGLNNRHNHLSLRRLV